MTPYAWILLLALGVLLVGSVWQERAWPASIVAAALVAVLFVLTLAR